MEASDLYSLREHFTNQRILLCFNGPISRSLIEEIGIALKNYLHAEQAKPSAATDVFATYIEMSQNIRHYSTSHGYGDLEGQATVVIGRDESEHYTVSAGNVVEIGDGEALVERIDALALLDKAQLKAACKEQLRKPREPGAGGGAGLGLLDISRRSSAPLVARLTRLADERAFFSLHATI